MCSSSVKRCSIHWPAITKIGTQSKCNFCKILLRMVKASIIYSRGVCVHFSNRMYMRDVVETTHIFFKLMEKFCNGSVVVQDKRKSHANGKKAKKLSKPSNNNKKSTEDEMVSRIRMRKLLRYTKKKTRKNVCVLKWILEFWRQMGQHCIGNISCFGDGIDDIARRGASIAVWCCIRKTLGRSKVNHFSHWKISNFFYVFEITFLFCGYCRDDCMVRIHRFLHQEQFEHAVIMLRSAR